MRVAQPQQRERYPLEKFIVVGVRVVFIASFQNGIANLPKLPCPQRSLTHPVGTANDHRQSRPLCAFHLEKVVEVHASRGAWCGVNEELEGDGGGDLFGGLLGIAGLGAVED